MGGCLVVYGEDYSFRINPAKDYSQSLYQVLCNEEPINGVQGVYTISAVTSQKTIKVENLELNKYNVTFADIDGIDFLYNAGENEAIVCGEAFTFTAQLQDKYSYSDAKILANGTELVADEGIYSLLVTQNTVISAANITQNKCRVSFDTDGSIISVPSQYYLAGEYMTDFPKAVKDGCRFDGWIIDGVMVDSTLPYLINTDVTFTASYTIATPCISALNTVIYISDCDEEGNIIIPDSLNGMIITELHVSVLRGVNFTPTKLIMNNYITEVSGNSVNTLFVSLKEVIFSPCLRKIGSYTFATTEIEVLDLPATVTEIESFAFNRCGNLTTVTCMGLTVSETDSFSYCNRLETFNSGKLTTIESNAFANCASLRNIDLSEVSVIEDSAFVNAFTADAGYEVTFNNDVELGSDAFASSRVSSVTFLKNAKLGSDAFSSTNIGSVTLSKASQVDVGAFASCSNLTTAVVPNLAANLFSGNNALRLVTVLNEVKSFPEKVFSSCFALTELVFPQNSLVETIGNSAFERAGNNIQELRIRGDALTDIGRFAFSNASIQKLTITSGSLPLTIGLAAFSECKILEFNLPTNTVAIGAFAFAKAFYSSFYEGISLPTGLQTIGTQAFIGSRWSEITIPNTVTAIELGALAVLEPPNEEVNVYFTGLPPTIFEDDALVYRPMQGYPINQGYAVDFTYTILDIYGYEDMERLITFSIRPTSITGDENFGLNYYFRVPVENEETFKEAEQFVDYSSRITSAVGTTHQAAFLNNYSAEDASYFIAQQSTVFTGGGKQFLIAPTSFPVREEYLFVGWFTEREGVTAFEFGKPLDIADDFALYAKWERIAHQVSYVLNGGTNDPSNPTEFYYDSNAPIGEATKIGYRFVGWYKDADYTESVYILSGAKDITLYAKYEPTKLRVSFEGMGVASIPYEVNYGEKAVKPTNPVVEGYTFLGWTYEGVLFDFDTPITERIVLTASYNRIPITITFDANGGMFEAFATQTVTAYKGETIEQNATPEKSGYYFNGWKDIIGNEVTMPITVDLKSTYYAEWQPGTYLVTLNYGYDSGYFYKRTNEKFGNLPIAYKTGYDFLGWFINDTKVVDTDVFDYAADIMLTPKYTPIRYMVAFNAGGGEGALPPNEELSYEESYTIPNCSLIRKGYDFVCWVHGDTEFNVGEEVQALQAYSTNNFSLTAKWQEKNYTIGFNAGEGSGSMQSLTKRAYEGFYLPNADALSYYGHTFVGWKCDEADYYAGTYLLAASLAQNDLIITFTAVWEKVECETEIIVNGISSSIWTEFGASISTFGAPTAVGQTFEGWFSDENGQGEEVTLPYSVVSTDKKTVYAYMRFISLTVSFENGGGIVVEGELPSDQIITYMGTVTEPTAPTADGYTFRSWVTANNREYDFSAPVTESIALYASWTVESFALTQISIFENSAQGSADSQSMILCSATDTLTFNSADKVYKDGCKLLGYYYDEEGEQPLQFPLTATQDTTVYARYKYATDQSLLKLLGNKATLLGNTDIVVISDICNNWHITAFDCGGYNFQSIEYNEYLTSLENISGYQGESLVLPSGLIYFDARSASGITSLTSYVLSANGSAYSVADGVLYKGTQLISYPVAKSETGEFFSETVTSVGEFALSNTAFTSVNLPNATEIKGYAFAGSTISEYVGLSELPPDFFGEGAFDMSALQEIELGANGATIFYEKTIPSCVQRVIYKGIGVLDNSIVGKAEGVTSLSVNGYTKLYCNFILFPLLANVTLTDVTEIGNHAFYYNRTTLTNITFCDELESIGAYAFFETENLNGDIPQSVRVINDYALYNSKLIKNKQLSFNLTYSGNAALVGDIITRITTDKSLDTLLRSYGEGVYSTLESVTFTGGESGDCRAFTALKEIYVDAESFCISKNAFANSGIQKLHINCNSNVLVSENAFANVVTLSDLQITAASCQLNSGCFAGCSAFTSLSISAQLSVVGDAPFADSSIEEINCDFSNTTLIGLVGANEISKVTANGDAIVYNAFSGNQITEVIIGENVRSIGGYAFADCPRLTNLTIPDSVNTVSDYALFGSSITEIEFSAKHSYYDMCGYDTSILTKAVVTAPNGESSLKERCFMNAVNLSSLTLPSGITEYSAYSLYNCASLTDINLSGISLGAYALFGRGLDSLTLAEGALYADNCLRGVTVNKLLLNNPLSIYKLFGVYNAVTSITLGSAVTSIPQSTFEGVVTNEIILHDKITAIGDRAFAGSNIVKVFLSGALTSIGDRAFYNCVDLAAITIPERVTYIGKYAFAGCERLETAEINGNISEILEGTFHECLSLSTVTLPASVEKIADYAFYYATKLNGLALPTAINSIGDFAFYNCTVMENLNFADTLTHIGVKAFYACASLTEVRLPRNVKEIGELAFAMCIKLTDMVLPDRLQTYGDGILDNDTQLVNLCIPSGMPLRQLFISDLPVTLTKVTFSAGNFRLANDVLKDVLQISEVIINEGVTVIGESAFENCLGLSSIRLPSTLLEIGKRAFKNTPIEEIELNDKLLRIGEGAFENTALVSVVIPDTVTAIADDTFYGCKELIEVTMSSQVREIGEYAFMRCAKLTRIDLPATVISVGCWAFAECRDLECVSFASNSKLEFINHYAFKGCLNLDNFVIPESVGYIGWGVFMDDESLEHLSIKCNNEGISKLTIDSFGYFIFQNTKIENVEDITLVDYKYAGPTDISAVVAAYFMRGEKD